MDLVQEEISGDLLLRLVGEDLASVRVRLLRLRFEKGKVTF